MKKICVLILLALSISGNLYAATTEEVEGYYQAGLQKGNLGMNDEAMAYFKKVVESDPSALENEYYMLTYSEAYFNMGLLNSKQQKWQESVENYKKGLAIFPKHKTASYYLSYSYLAIGEIAESIRLYNQAAVLGYTVEPQMGDFVGEALKPFRNKELTIKYKSFFNPDTHVAIQIEGNPIGNEELIRDAIGAIERASKLSGKGMFTTAKVAYIRNLEKGTVIIEKWTVDGEDEYWVKYDFAPPEGFPYKVIIEAREDENFGS